MSLFKTARKLLAIAFVIGLAAVAYLAYLNRERFNPVVDAYWAYQNKTEQAPQYLSSITGEVIKVLDGNWFHIKIPEGFVYAVRITGMEAPGLGRASESEELPLGNQCKENLTTLLQDQTVDVNVLEMNDLRYGQGFVYLNQTNVAQLLVQDGMGRLNRTEILGLEWEEKYHLARAERHAQENALGVYAAGLDLDFTTIQGPPDESSATETPNETQPDTTEAPTAETPAPEN